LEGKSQMLIHYRNGDSIQSIADAHRGQHSMDGVVVHRISTSAVHVFGLALCFKQFWLPSYLESMLTQPGMGLVPLLSSSRSFTLGLLPLINSLGEPLWHDGGEGAAKRGGGMSRVGNGADLHDALAKNAMAYKVMAVGSTIRPLMIVPRHVHFVHGRNTGLSKSMSCKGHSKGHSKLLTSLVFVLWLTKMDASLSACKEMQCAVPRAVVCHCDTSKKFLTIRVLM